MKTIQENNRKEIEDFRNEVTRSVHEMFMEDEMFYPTAFGLKKKNSKSEIFIIDGLERFTGDELNKQILFETLRLHNQTFKPIAYAFASEGYLRSFAPFLDENGEIIDELRDLAPEVTEEKKEVLFITFETYSEEGVIYWEIIRDENEKVIDLKLLIDKGWQSKEANGRHEGNQLRLLNENYSELAISVKKDLLQKHNLN